MASYAEWCNEKLSQLQNEENKTAALAEIQQVLSSLESSDLQKALPSIELQKVLDQLKDSQDSEQASTACSILAFCMKNLSLSDDSNVRDRYLDFIEQALNSQFSEAKYKILLELKREIANEDFLVEVCKKKSILLSLIKCFTDAECSVFQQAHEVLCLIGASSFGLKQMLEDDVKGYLLEICKDKLVKLRVYETIVEICNRSEEGFKAIEAVGLLRPLIDSQNDDDILLRMNILELLSRLSNSKQGLDYLESQEVLKKLYATFEGDETYLKLSEPSIYKFFGDMALRRPKEMLTKYPNYLQKLVDNLKNPDVSLFGTCLFTIGLIASTDEGKMVFASKDDLMPNIIKTAVERINYIPSENKRTVLYFLESILKADQNSNKQITAITEKWFKCIGDDPIQFIVNHTKMPFPEFRIAGLSVLRAIADQSWGQEAIRNAPGLIEVLLDRTSENTKINKEIKYEVIKSLAESPLFDEVTSKRLKTYVAQGPFYVEAVTEVAVE